MEPSYSDVANEQLDQLLASGDYELYDILLDTCEWILDKPNLAQSAAITTDQGIRFRYLVKERPDYKVFWASDGPTIEAAFPYPA